MQIPISLTRVYATQNRQMTFSENDNVTFQFLPMRIPFKSNANERFRAISFSPYVRKTDTVRWKHVILDNNETTVIEFEFCHIINIHAVSQKIPPIFQCHVQTYKISNSGEFACEKYTHYIGMFSLISSLRAIIISLEFSIIFKIKNMIYICIKSWNVNCNRYTVKTKHDQI